MSVGSGFLMTNRSLKNLNYLDLIPTVVNCLEPYKDVKLYEREKREKRMKIELKGGVVTSITDNSVKEVKDNFMRNK